MGTTTNGLPYMDDTDPLASVAAKMQALAEAVDAARAADAAARVPQLMRRGIPGTALPTLPNAAVTDLAWPTLIDSDGAGLTYQNGKEIRVDVAGRYDVAASIRFTANGTGRRTFSVYLNTTTSILDCESAASATGLVTVAGSVLGVDLAAGDVLKVAAYQDSGAARALLGTEACNFFTVIRRPLG